MRRYDDVRNAGFRFRPGFYVRLPLLPLLPPLTVGRPQYAGAGFTLAEVLVSLFVLSAGVIGIAALQLQSHRSIQQSGYQSAALDLAADMAHQIRAASRSTKPAAPSVMAVAPATVAPSGNSLAPGDSDSHASTSTSGPVAATDVFAGLDLQSGTAAVPAKPCYASGCSVAELLAFESHGWTSRLQAALPGGRAIVCRDDQPWSAATAAWQWACTEGPSDPLVIKVGWRQNALASASPSSSSSSSSSSAIAADPLVVLFVGKSF